MTAIQSLIIASFLSVTTPAGDCCELPPSSLEGTRDAAAQDGMVLAHAQRAVAALLDEIGVQGTIHGRIKSPESLKAKALRKGLAEDDVLDRLALRVLVRDVADCDLVRDALVSRLELVADSEDDYIRHPKANGYRSLHLALHAGPADEVVEVQVRTWAMHAHAEHGAAAHQHYKASQPALTA